MAKIEYHRDRGNYLEIYDHESLNDINDALYEYCEKTGITVAPDALSSYRYISATSMQYEHRPYR